MHLLDLVHWLVGPLPLHSALLRTQFWDTPVEDNAALLLGEPASRTAPWAMLHVSWTEWKNRSRSRSTAAPRSSRSTGSCARTARRRCASTAMKPELGPPDSRRSTYRHEDVSWQREWEHFAAALAPARRRCWAVARRRALRVACVEDAYAGSAVRARCARSSLA